jgi:hypothetical protein
MDWLELATNADSLAIVLAGCGIPRHTIHLRIEDFSAEGGAWGCDVISIHHLDETQRRAVVAVFGEPVQVETFAAPMSRDGEIRHAARWAPVDGVRVELYDWMHTGAVVTK